MADFNSAFTANLGDFLSWLATQRGVSRNDIEKTVELHPINVEGHAFFWYAFEGAKKLFNEKAREFDYVVDLREGLRSV